MAATLLRHAGILWALAAVFTAGCCHSKCQQTSSCQCHHHCPCQAGAAVIEENVQPTYLPPRAAATAEPPLTAVAEAVPGGPHHRGESRTRLASASTPATAFGHAPDYSWLSGELWYVPGKNCWRVHYAGGGEQDQYGGVMTLSDAGPMADYRIGQLVYVEGKPAEGSARSGTAVYRVTKMLELATSNGHDSTDPSVERVSGREESPD